MCRAPHRRSNRYRHFHARFSKQVEALQKSVAFLTVAREFYDEGFKDWHILSAVYNLRLNWEMRRLGIDVFDGMHSRDTVRMVSEIIEHSIEPPERIVASKDDLARMFDMADLTCLKTYGFELRRPDVKPDALRRFLRERMRHYDLDLPHEQLFGGSDGAWPATSGRSAVNPTT